MIKNNNIFRIKYSNDIFEIKNDNLNKIIICYFFIKNDDIINEKFINLCNNDNNIIILLINICEYEPNINNEIILDNIPYFKIFNDKFNKYFDIINNIILNK